MLVLLSSANTFTSGIVRKQLKVSTIITRGMSILVSLVFAKTIEEVFFIKFLSIISNLGPSITIDRFSSFLKARLNCSIPADVPFYFNELRKCFHLNSNIFINFRVNF